MTPGATCRATGGSALTQSLGPVRALTLALLVALIWLVYGPVVEGYFIGDDFVHLEQVLQEPWNLLANDDPDRWFRPLTKLLFAVDHAVWGLAPRGYHATNLVIHATNALLVAGIAHWIFGLGPAAALATLLFAVHPAHTVTVAWISARADLLAAGWTLVAVLAHARLRRGGGIGSRLCVAAAVILAVASKESGVGAPLLLLTLDRSGAFGVAGQPPPWKRSVVTWGALMGLVGAFVLVRAWVLGDPIGGYGTRRLAASPWLLYEVILATGRLLAPVRVMGLDAVPRAGLAAAILAVEGLGLVAILRGNGARRRMVILGTVWFATALVPVASLLTFRWGGGAERYLYLPSIGVTVALASLLAPRAPSGPLPRRLLVAVAAVVVVLLAWAARREAVAWAAVTGAAPDIQSALLADPVVREGDVVLIFNADTNLHRGLPFDVMLQTQLERALAPPYFPLSIRPNPYRLSAPPERLHAFLWTERERRLVRVDTLLRPGPSGPLPAWEEFGRWVAHDLQGGEGRFKVSGTRPALVSPSLAVRTFDVRTVEVTIRTSGCASWSPCDAWTRLVDTWRPGQWRLAWTTAGAEWRNGPSVAFRVPAAPGFHRISVDLVYDFRWFAAGSVERLTLLPPPAAEAFELAAVRLVPRYGSWAHLRRGQGPGRAEAPCDNPLNLRRCDG